VKIAFARFPPALLFPFVYTGQEKIKKETHFVRFFYVHLRESQTEAK